MMGADRTSEPWIDVVITNHNYNAYVPGAVESALNQRNVHTSVVIVDDGSDEPLQGFDDDDRVRIIRREVAGGVAAALNLGVAAGSAPLVAFLDADDLWPRNRCHCLCEAIIDADLAYGAQVVFAEGNQPDLDPPPEALAAMGGLSAALLPGSTLLRRSLFERFGLFPVELTKGPFIYWMAGLRSADPPVQEVPVHKPVLLRRAHATNMTRSHSQVGDYFQALAKCRSRHHEADREALSTDDLSGGN
jgi:glycosyltransferase involved in cell wall biosynthesis